MAKLPYGIFLASALAVAACVGGGSSSDGPPIEDAGSSGMDAATGTSDGGGPDGCAPGTKSCVDGITLATCGQTTMETCAIECSTVGGAHCALVQPNAPVTVADLATPSVVAVTIGADALLDTATGAIEGIRAPNTDPATQETKSGIAFRLVGNVGVFSVKSFKVNSGSTLKLRGPAAFAIAAAETIEIVGVVDARGYDKDGVLCGVPNTTLAMDTSAVAGPGGSPGGSRDGAANGTGPGAGGGKGVAGFTAGSTAGPGGGGFGGAGGEGGAYTGSGGAIVPMPTPIAGGFGGGASGGAGGANGAQGGGGGGAVQLVAGVSIAIGGGPNPGGVNAGGCGGSGAAFGETGSGGGSGGAILLQSPAIDIKALGVLAANGGAGSTGNGSARGEHGKLGKSFAIGPAAAGSYGKGGNGAPGLVGTPEAMLAGDPGGPPTGARGGAGGGGVGRIRLENKSGSISMPADGVVSPVIATGPSAATTVGVLSVK